MTPIEVFTHAIERCVENSKLRQYLWEVVNDPGFQSGWGSADKHHAYKGGLYYHTAEVLDLALAQAKSNSISVNLEVLVAAVIFHDVMKIRDYNTDGKPTYYKSIIYHVAGSYANWEMTARGEFDDSFVDAVGHCILAHHGRREWKACVEPQTVEAFILHHADMLSANFGKTREAPVEVANV